MPALWHIFPKSFGKIFKIFLDKLEKLWYNNYRKKKGINNYEKDFLHSTSLYSLCVGRRIGIWLLLWGCLWSLYLGVSCHGEKPYFGAPCVCSLCRHFCRNSFYHGRRLKPSSIFPKNN